MNIISFPAACSDGDTQVLTKDAHETQSEIIMQISSPFIELVEKLNSLNITRRYEFDDRL